MKAKALALALLLYATASVQAQQVWQSVAVASPAVYQDETGYYGCGLRVVVGMDNDAEMHGADFSVNVFLKPQPWGGIKVGAISCTKPCNPAGRIEKPVDEFRLAEEVTGIPVEILGTVPAEQPEYKLAVVSVDNAIETLTALLGGKQMQLSVIPKGSSYRRVYSFRSELSEADFRAFNSCIGPVLDKLPSE